MVTVGQPVLVNLNGTPEFSPVGAAVNAAFITAKGIGANSDECGELQRPQRSRKWWYLRVRAWTCAPESLMQIGPPSKVARRCTS